MEVAVSAVVDFSVTGSLVAGSVSVVAVDAVIEDDNSTSFVV